MVGLLNRQRSLLQALYPVLVVLVINQLVTLAISARPFQFDEATWRFGAAGLLISSLPTMAIASILLLAVAAILDHRLWARAVGIWAIVVAVLVGVTLISFGLDALQVRRLVLQERKAAFDASALKALTLVIMFVPTLLWAGWSGFRMGKGAGEGRGDDGPPIVVGQG